MCVYTHTFVYYVVYHSYIYMSHIYSFIYSFIEYNHGHYILYKAMGIEWVSLYNRIWLSYIKEYIKIIYAQYLVYIIWNI